MTTTDQIIKGIILNEGSAYTNDPKDRGGPTKYGITQSALSSYLKRPATIADVQGITDDLATKIYQQMYIDAPGYSDIQDPLRALIVDTGVNCGPGNATKMIQRVVNSFGCGPIVVDGGMGPKTRAAITKAISLVTMKDVVNSYVDQRKAYYKAIVDSDPSQSRFINGWFNRAESFRIH